MKMTENQNKVWRFDRQVNLSVLVQLVFLASLIVGSWVNLQGQLNLLQHDVKMLVESNSKFQDRFESLSAKNIEYEYRLRSIEKSFSKSGCIGK